MKAKVQRHQFGDGFDIVGAVTQCLQALASHTRAHDFVVMKCDALALKKPAGLGLAHIVQQRSDAGSSEVVLTGKIAGHVLDNCQRVREHIFVTVNRILFEPHGRQFGKELASDSVVDEKHESL